ncbi:MFS family permease [Angulomicrobium tetraedrale]|uniref:MFS family permease n=1 Tax=Ancylobacter tetraedralis TaxID=217068 RepID=A0A839Z884_9HYPH|nr:MFS transporter [Ancylobacter tetraedralis]MBB3770375.1 MFS family permease [Ancylobacter tetraedralis]
MSRRLASADFGPIRAILPLVLAIAIVTAGSGLLTTRTALELSLAKASVGAIRSVITGYPLGFLLGCALARPMIARIGHGRAFQLMAALTGLATMLFLASSEVWVWTGLRIVNGFAMAVIFTVAESWINLDSGPRNRGSLIAFYMIMSTLGLVAGQSMINLGDPTGAGLILLAALICLAAALPFAVDGRMRPAGYDPSRAEPATDEVVSFGRLLRITPLIVVLAVLQTGMTNMNFGVLAPIYATHTGHPAGTAAALVIVFSLGGFIAQFPVGWLSDRIDRPLILAGAGLIAALCCLATALFGHLSTPLLFVLLFVYGATTLCIYPVAIAYAGATIERRFVVAVSGRLLFVYSIGAVIAPPLSNELMARTEPAALFLFLGAISLIVGVGGVAEFALSRRRRTE